MRKTIDVDMGVWDARGSVTVTLPGGQEYFMCSGDSLHWKCHIHVDGAPSAHELLVRREFAPKKDRLPNRRLLLC